jgi:hypothetical protein
MPLAFSSTTGIFAMTKITHRITKADVDRLLANSPDRNIGGTVCVSTHLGGTYSVLHLSSNGTGWSSLSTPWLPLAELCAEVLADRCRARLVHCDCDKEREASDD